MHKVVPNGKASYCLLGGDVTNSPSPFMMNRAFAELSIDANYTAMSVRREDLERAFAELKEKRIAGLNVTMPFKTAITSLLDGLDDRSARVGAVNVVKKSDSEYLGFNTDVDGVIKPLRKAIPREKVDRAVLIGTGGAARAFLEGLHQFKCSQILLLVRSLNRGKAFLEEQKKKYPNMSIELHQIAEVGGLSVREVDVLLNATPMGSAGVPISKEILQLIGSTKVVFDAVYLPRETELLQAARRSGCEAIYGYEMLLWQATAAFELWTGLKAPSEAMRLVLLDFLGRRDIE